MTRYAIEPPVIPVLPIAGEDAVFPVRRVYCIGRNYATHPVEMAQPPDRPPPLVFQKNPDNLDPSGAFPYPPGTSDVHHEAEIAVMLGSGGQDISLADALTHVFGYALALDMTRRDVLDRQKKMARPWEIAKAFERSAPIGPIHRVEKVGHLTEGRFSLSVNGDLRQERNLNQMIWKVPAIISYLSETVMLAAGDVILSGTPAGAGPVQRGDEIVVDVEGLGQMAVTVV